eukprot:3704312-Amphidinium_carterae.1
MKGCMERFVSATSLKPAIKHWHVVTCVHEGARQVDQGGMCLRRHSIELSDTEHYGMALLLALVRLYKCLENDCSLLSLVERSPSSEMEGFETELKKLSKDVMPDTLQAPCNFRLQFDMLRVAASLVRHEPRRASEPDSAVLYIFCWLSTATQFAATTMSPPAPPPRSNKRYLWLVSLSMCACESVHLMRHTRASWMSLQQEMASYFGIQTSGKGVPSMSSTCSPLPRRLQ